MKTKIKAFIKSAKQYGPGSYAFAIDGRGRIRHVLTDDKGEKFYDETYITAEEAIKLVNNYDRWLPLQQASLKVLEERLKALQKMQKSERDYNKARDAFNLADGNYTTAKHAELPFFWTTRSGVDVGYTNDGLIRVGCNRIPIQFARKFVKLLKRKKR